MLWRVTRAFISYSHTDRAFATKLAEALPALGIEPWIDHDGIHGGARWSSSIQQALDAAAERGEADALASAQPAPDAADVPVQPGRKK
jgi:hypothetical protein